MPSVFDKLGLEQMADSLQTALIPEALMTWLTDRRISVTRFSIGKAIQWRHIKSNSAIFINQSANYLKKIMQRRKYENNQMRLEHNTVFLGLNVSLLLGWTWSWTNSEMPVIWDAATPCYVTVMNSSADGFCITMTGHNGHTITYQSPATRLLINTFVRLTH